MTPEVELLPCPFCGSPNIIEGTDGWGKVFHACRECKAHGPTRTVTWANTYPNPTAWNRRNIDNPSQGVLI